MHALLTRRKGRGGMRARERRMRMRRSGSGAARVRDGGAGRMSMRRRETVLETRDLSMHFGGVKAVDRVELHAV